MVDAIFYMLILQYRMLHAVLISSNEKLFNWCRETIAPIAKVSLVRKFSRSKIVRNDFVILDADYLKVHGDQVLVQLQKISQEADDIRRVILISSHGAPAMSFSLFSDFLNSIDATFYLIDFSESNLSASVGEFFWFMESQKKILLDLREIHSLGITNRLLSQRFAELNHSELSEVVMPPALHGRSVEISLFREKLLVLSSQNIILAIIGEDERALRECALYQTRLKYPHGNIHITEIDFHNATRSYQNDALGNLTAFSKGSKKTPENIIILHQVQELTWENQLKLMSVLSKIEQFDDEKSPHIVLTASSDISQKMREGKFRQELYYFLKKKSIVFPALHTRIGDLTAIAAAYLSNKKIASMSMNQLVQSEKVLEHFDVSMGYHGLFTTLDLLNDIELSGKIPLHALNRRDHQPESYDAARAFVRQGQTGGEFQQMLFNSLAESTDEHASLEAIEKFYIVAVLDRHQGSVTETSRQLRISRKTLYEKMRRYKIKKPENAKTRRMKKAR